MSDIGLSERVAAYLAAHHTMSLATAGVMYGEAEPGMPHAATVFYAVDGSLRLIFISKPSSIHGRHIGERAPVAVTVSEDYGDWRDIKGVQIWGEARLLSGVARAKAMALYLARFPFVRDMMRQPKLAELIAEIGVYRVEPFRVAFTDNSTGVFGREVLDLRVG